MPRARTLVGLLSVLGLTSSCRCGGESVESNSVPALGEPEAVAPRELEAEVPRASGLERCRWIEGESALRLRAERRPLEEDAAASDQPGIELGSAVAWADGFAVGVLRLGAHTSAEIAVTDGRGRSRQIALGEVHGPSDPPRLTNVGGALLLALVDNDASGSVLRLGRVADPFGEGRVVWGPEVPEGRDASPAFALAVAGAQGLLVWDAEQASAARSSLWVQPFDAATLAARGPRRRFESAGPDADGPLLLPRPHGHWLIWSSYDENTDPGAGTAEERGLIEDPLARLMGVALDEAGTATSRPLELARHRLQSIDGIDRPDGGFVLALRTSDPEYDSRTILVLRVEPDGTHTEEVTRHLELGVGSPLLLRSSNIGGLWLSSQAADNGCLLGLVPTGGPVLLEAERLLEGRELLAAGERGWLVAEPRGHDIDLRVASCSEPAAAPLR